MIEIISDYNRVDISQWQEFIKKHPNGNIFQTPEMYAFFKSVKNYDPYIFVALDKQKKIVGVLLAVVIKETRLAGFFSARCIIWGGPLVSGQSNAQKIMGLLLTEFNKTLSGKTIYTEFRNLFSIKEFEKVFEEEKFVFNGHYNFIVDLRDKELLWKRINSGKKRQIKKSLKNGAKIVEPTDIKEVKEFYQILFHLYKSKVKKPLPSFSFFENFFYNKELGKYLLIEYNSKIVGGIMCPVYKDTIYEWYVCGLDREYKDIYPSVLATWAAIYYGMKNNLKYFDFMGAGKPDQDYGVRKFKSQFGGELVNYGRYIRINNKFLYYLGKFGLKLYQKLRF
ncbi:Methicillin resistance protein [Caldithrix abyssi DSM 13497]|uniref:Lipid II:glycine glycyltransferase (Peptidoglycan interpeptide bridge formation enzyme) n=1 Tax=Caldithrix abyssi DSM 13497 TaxID=880073 RepID=H1XRP6_CALAY|nr:peptidoglycan bridge formation glycyltransferase FemA/FemB family protein [Caldithrix abyssi]APF20138.1 Lipid II:glycine glycyltransferase (Peptidoglycan interpeptide bridge formation enzyme) [Caldithrix abyssi DSM 13497]EHO40199.1 Methicillin resistance protein [Caldithrix abyssi DSM 13497]